MSWPQGPNIMITNKKRLRRVMFLHPPVEIALLFLFFVCQELRRIQGSAGSVGCVGGHHCWTG